jgi:hypothetical protein
MVKNSQSAPAVKKEDCLRRAMPFCFPHDHATNQAEPGD